MTTLLLPVAAAMETLQRPTGTYLGADGFWLEPDGIAPSLEHIADISAVADSHPQETRAELAAVLARWPTSPSFAVELVRLDDGFAASTPFVTGPIDLHLLDRVAIKRHLDWRQKGLTWSVGHGPPTPKPAAWLSLSNASRDGQLTVWVSGEAEMDWGGVDETHARHYDLADDADLQDAVRHLEEAVGHM